MHVIAPLLPFASIRKGCDCRVQCLCPVRHPISATIATASAKAASLDVSLHCVPAGQHLFLLGAGRVPETDAAIAEMGQWLRSKLAVSH